MTNYRNRGPGIITKTKEANVLIPDMLSYGFTMDSDSFSESYCLPTHLQRSIERD
jgi:hypothetical protein